MGLASILTGKWFSRLVLISCIVCSVAIYFVFKNMEFIVHGQLYYFGLIFSAEWADSYRVFTWLLFVFLGVPIALSGLALASSFLIRANTSEREHIVPQRAGPPRGITKVGNMGSPQSRSVQHSRLDQKDLKDNEPDTKTHAADNGNILGMSCPECNKVFGRALVMLDFRSGSNKMISVCPYCNHVLGFTGEEKNKDDDFHVGSQDKKLLH
jgi:hypothetical protein